MCSSDLGGVFLWPPNVLERVNKVKLVGCTSLQEKQLQIVGYLFELFYDLMISPEDNVSVSPGFETCLGIFGGK